MGKLETKLRKHSTPLVLYMSMLHARNSEAGHRLLETHYI
jgi:hypothetical protein